MRTSIKFSLVLIMAVAGAKVHADDTITPLNSFDSLDISQSTAIEPTATTTTRTTELVNIVDENAPVEVIEERYEDGRVKVRREVTLDQAGNYIKHGQWKAFSPTEEEVASGEFRNNQREGAWSKILNWGDAELLNELPFTEFEAPFVSKAEFKDGKLNGQWKIVDAQDRVASEWNYIEGKLDGTAKWFYPNGDLREEITYSDGLIDGTYKMWDADGAELNNDTFQDGRKLASKQELYASGVVKWEGMFLHETYLAKAEDDWWKSKPVSYEKSGDPERHGKFTSWYEQGQKKFEGMFEHEIRSGEFTWWHENTQKAVQGSFKSDERHGQWSWWHENGQKAIHGQYDNGKLDGKWFYWNADGKLERKMDYTGDSEPVAVHSIPSTDIPAVADQRALPRTK